MKNKFLNILFVLACFLALPAVSAETGTEQIQYLTDTKAAIVVQKQPSQESNQKQVVQNIRWAIVIQCQGKPVDTSKSDN